MSTKSTIVLSDDNEHVYYDCYDDTINIEVDVKNIVEHGVCDDGYYISIKASSDLGKQLLELAHKGGVL